MGFPKKLVDLVIQMYGNATSQGLVNVFLTEPFEIHSGVRQGCPLSPLLFICAMEPLLQSIRKDKLVKGLIIPGSGGQHIKDLGYMDDLCVFCETVCEVTRVKLLVNCFCIALAFTGRRAKSKLSLNLIFLIVRWSVEGRGWN